VEAIAGKEEKLEFEAEVIESLRGGMHRVMLDSCPETLA
jgi:translation initiation factor IF-1